MSVFRRRQERVAERRRSLDEEVRQVALEVGRGTVEALKDLHEAIDVLKLITDEIEERHKPRPRNGVA